MHDDTCTEQPAAAASPRDRFAIGSIWELPTKRLAVIEKHGSYVQLRYLDAEGGEVTLRRDVMQHSARCVQ